MRTRSLAALSIAVLLACANRIDARLAEARTVADVSALTGTSPACDAVQCTWRSRVARKGCTGYAECGSAKRREAAERVVTCRVDDRERVSDCTAAVVR
jgi:hypothetical protein